jgi:predicted nucleic acid-binding protein
MRSEKRRRFNGKLYRVSNLKEGPYKKSLVKKLMSARRDVGKALKNKNKTMERKARKLVHKFKKKLRNEELTAAITSGGIDSMEKYNYIIGQINALEATKQELSNLLEDKEQNEGTVIDINNKTTK